MCFLILNLSAGCLAIKICHLEDSEFRLWLNMSVACRCSLQAVVQGFFILVFEIFALETQIKQKQRKNGKFTWRLRDDTGANDVFFSNAHLHTSHRTKNDFKMVLNLEGISST